MAYYSLLGGKMDVSENPDDIPGGGNRLTDQRVFHVAVWFLA